MTTFEILYIRNTKRLIEKYYSKPNYGISDIARELRINTNYFASIFKKTCGITPIKALTSHRLKVACKMLKFTDMYIKEIAANCGFNDKLYFSRLFKKVFGVSPSKYRKEKFFLT